MRRLSSLWLLWLAFGVTSVAAADAAAPAVEIVSAEFGLFDAGASGEVVLTPATLVPRRAGQRYGWVIEVRARKRSLSVREEYLLPNAKPAPPPDNAVAANLAVPLARQSQVSQRQLVPVDGQIYGDWSIGPNEPAGRRQLQVVIEGAATVRFEFDVR